MTTAGFTSAVLHPALDGRLVVRARDHESLEDLVAVLGLEQTVIYTEFPSDYPYRVAVTKEQYKTYVCAAVDGIKYRNFKDAATAKRGRIYHDALMQVWTAMLALTPQAVQDENNAAWGHRFADVFPEMTTYRKSKRGSGKKKRPVSAEYYTPNPR